MSGRARHPWSPVRQEEQGDGESAERKPGGRSSCDPDNRDRMREHRSECGAWCCHRAAFNRTGFTHRARDGYAVPDADRRTAHLDNPEPSGDLH